MRELTMQPCLTTVRVDPQFISNLNAFNSNIAAAEREERNHKGEDPGAYTNVNFMLSSELFRSRGGLRERMARRKTVRGVGLQFKDFSIKVQVGRRLRKTKTREQRKEVPCPMSRILDEPVNTPRSTSSKKPLGPISPYVKPCPFFTLLIRFESISMADQISLLNLRIDINK